MILRFGTSAIWRSIPASFPSPEQRWFHLYIGKKPVMFPKSKDGTPMGPLTQISSAVSYSMVLKTLMSTFNTVPLDLIERIADTTTSIFVQLVFVLAVPNIFSYTIIFAPAFIHTIKIIEEYFEEMSLCISSANFDHSVFVRDNICDLKFKVELNRALNEVTIEYGGLKYRQERAEHIRKECLRKNEPGILHRLWPTLAFASTTIGASFTMYKNEIQYYCGEKLPLINMLIYCGSEGFYGSLASIHTNEYFLSPISTFFEFIKEEDIHQSQPKTVLISEIMPGNRYELVITTEAGLVRYRMGDVIDCTRFLSRADDLIPLPAEPAEIPRIPLISVAYRVGSLLDVFGEKTTEQHVMHALKETVDQWKNQGIYVDLCDFTAYTKLDDFPSKYVIFLELTNEQGHEIDDQQLQILQNSADSEVEQQLCSANDSYQLNRKVHKLGPLVCVLKIMSSQSIPIYRRPLFSTSTVHDDLFDNYDIVIIFHSSQNFSKMNTIGYVNPYFVATIDDQISFTSTSKWNDEEWIIRNIPRNAKLLVKVCNKNEKGSDDNYIGEFEILNIINYDAPPNGHIIIDSYGQHKGHFHLSINSKKSSNESQQLPRYTFDGPCRYSRYDFLPINHQHFSIVHFHYV
ncbi:unnamed protein product, partial [Adineta steineri]